MSNTNKYSEWLKIDLHIHSYISNKVKPNDFNLANIKNDSKIEDYISLLRSKLINENISIFSIVDHNIINFEVYDEIANKDILKDVASCVCGIEMDIYDTEINDKPFHLLIFFNEYIKMRLQSFIDKLHTKQINENTKWTFAEVYKAMHDAGLREYLLIPHFNEKHKSLSVKDVMKINKPLTIFDAFEDGNNSSRISKSISSYLKSNITDFPTVAFSDWHNKNEEKTSITSILGSKDTPFNSLKLSFNDPMMRISLDGVEGTRKSNIERIYIKHFTVNNEPIELSPYQNTIIGGFGSGKSLLGALIRGDEEMFNEKYALFIDMKNEFKIEFSDGTIKRNIKEYFQHEDKKYNYYELKQNNKLYMVSKLDQDIRKKLEENLNIKFPKLEKKLLNDFIQYYSNEKIERIKYLLSQLEVDVQDDSIQYNKLNNLKQALMISEDKLEINSFDDINNQLKTIPGIIGEFEKYYIFENINAPLDEQTLKEIKNVELHRLIIEKMIENVDERFTKLDKTISSYNSKINRLTNGKRHQITIINGIKKNIHSFKSELSELKSEVNTLEEYFSHKIIDTEIHKINYEPISKNYQTIASFKRSEVNNNIKNLMLRSEYTKNTLFEGIVNAHLDANGLLGKKKFDKIMENIKTEYNKIFNVEFNIQNSVTNECILDKSPGGRAIMLMQILLELVETIDDEKFNLLFIDQPEDQLDNRNIYSIIVDEIRKIKYHNLNLQIIFISHNANISIAADSENIIIASKDKEVIYNSGSLERIDHSTEIANILEGGPEALKKRGIKLNINNYKDNWGE